MDEFSCDVVTSFETHTHSMDEFSRVVVTSFETHTHFTPWEKAINAIYASDYTGSANEFDAILSETPALTSHIDGGWGLAHFLFDNMDGPWTEGVAAYVARGGDLSIKTCDYITSMGGSVGVGLCIVGGRTVLHVAAIKLGKNPAVFDALCVLYADLNILDLNGDSPRSLLGRAHIPAAEFKLVRARNPVKLIDLRRVQPAAMTHLPSGTGIDLAGVRVFTLSEDFIAALQEGVSAAPRNIPNSMHRYGKVLLPFMDGAVRALCASALPPDVLGRVKHIHAFSVKYSRSQDARQTSLGPHRDDSDFTINVCLSNDSTGAELVFDASRLNYTHVAGRGLVHNGDFEHHVTELESGDRECVIIWVRVSC
jgi:hypothetical protein